jgi:hypothetical protein
MKQTVEKSPVPGVKLRQEPKALIAMRTLSNLRFISASLLALERHEVTDDIRQFLSREFVPIRLASENS